jgi:thiosulfate/3-mercaptopyruvate sulfurtransferase
MRGGPLGVAVILLAGLLLAACQNSRAESPTSGEAWDSNLVEPATLARELASAEKPIVLCTAPPFMYHANHVPGAVFHGPMTSPQVQEELTAWAKTLPHNANIVVYCGCCPLSVCPNVRPAYKLLKDLGFKRVRVLNLPTNFPTDWTSRGLPVER